MDHASSTTSQPFTRPPARAGFSFVEVLFAVMILGVGFIMIAAIFPVAIKQTQLTVEDAGGVRTLINARSQVTEFARMVPTGTWVPTTATPATAVAPRVNGQVSAMNENLPWGAATIGAIVRPYVQGNQIDLSDPRFAWTIAYKVDAVWDGAASRTSQTIDFYVFVVASRQRSVFDLVTDSLRYSHGANNVATTPDSNQNEPVRFPAGIDSGSYPYFNALGSGTAYPANLEPKVSFVKLYRPNDAAGGGLYYGTSGGVQFIAFSAASSGGHTPVVANSSSVGGNTGAVGEGMFFVVKDDDHFNTPTYLANNYNGLIFKLGSEVAAGKYNLEPGYDILSAMAKGAPIPPVGGTTGNIQVLHVGRTKQNPNIIGEAFAGPVQDINLVKFTYSRP